MMPSRVWILAGLDGFYFFLGLKQCVCLVVLVHGQVSFDTLNLCNNHPDYMIQKPGKIECTNRQSNANVEYSSLVQVIKMGIVIMNMCLVF